MRKLFCFLTIVGLSLSSLAISSAYADHEGKSCAMCGHTVSPKGSYGRDEAYVCPVTDKFMSKVRFFLKNQKDLGLSEDQIDSIKALKLEVKKTYIRNMAEHQIFSLDLQQKLSEPQIDTESINAMIDQLAALMTSSAKNTVVAYAKLKSVLSEEQLVKAKELRLSEKA